MLQTVSVITIIVRPYHVCVPVVKAPWADSRNTFFKDEIGYGADI